MKQKIIEFAKSHFDGQYGCHDRDHTQRVAKTALLIGKEEGADCEILEYAALLHDIGRPIEDASRGSVCHAETGARIAQNFLNEIGLSQDTIDHIVHCIHSHRSKNDIIPQTLEAKILFDADKLDSLGATGIGRAFMFAQAFGSKLHNDKSIDIYQTQAYTPEDTAYREYIFKCKDLKDKLFTQTGKNLAEQRHLFMESFFEQLNKEIRGEY